MLIKQEIPDSIFINDDIYNYLETLTKNKNNLHGHMKKKYKKNDFDNDLEIIQEDKKIGKIFETRGLDDNNTNDNELKSKKIYTQNGI